MALTDYAMLRDSTIVVATDLTSDSAPALDAACSLAERFCSAKFVLTHGVKPSGLLGKLGDRGQAAYERAREAMDAVEIPCSPPHIERVVRTGPPARVAVEVAAEMQADLVVTSSHGFGAVRRAVIGSVANAIVRASPCPVLVVGPDRPGLGAFRSITVAVDGSPISEAVVSCAVAFGVAHAMPLRLLSVFEAPGAAVSDAGGIDAAADIEAIGTLRRAFEERLQALAAQASEGGAQVEVVMVEHETPADAILHDLRDHPGDLLVLGTSGHDGWHRLVLGGTADRVVCEATRPVLVVPAGSVDEV